MTERNRCLSLTAGGTCKHDICPDRRLLSIACQLYHETFSVHNRHTKSPFRVTRYVVRACALYNGRRQSRSSPRPSSLSYRSPDKSRPECFSLRTSKNRRKRPASIWRVRENVASPGNGNRTCRKTPNRLGLRRFTRRRSSVDLFVESV